MWKIAARPRNCC